MSNIYRRRRQGAKIYKNNDIQKKQKPVENFRVHTWLLSIAKAISVVAINIIHIVKQCKSNISLFLSVTTLHRVCISYHGLYL